MGWLGEWLRSVVAVILLAAFVDLFLPSNAMQRYVKAVISLIILLTLLTPVLQLLERKFSVDQLLSAAASQQERTLMLTAERNSAPMKSLEVITRDAEKLKAVGHKQSEQLLQEQLALVMKEDLQKQTDLHVDQVKVTAKLDNNGKPTVSHVLVTLHEIKMKSLQKPVNERSIAVMEPIQPVKPIQIGQEVSASRAASGEAQMLTPMLEQELARLSQGISRDWQIDRAHVELQLVAGGSKQ